MTKTNIVTGNSVPWHDSRALLELTTCIPRCGNQWAHQADPCRLAIVTLYSTAPSVSDSGPPFAGGSREGPVPLVAFGFGSNRFVGVGTCKKCLSGSCADLELHSYTIGFPAARQSAQSGANHYHLGIIFEGGALAPLLLAREPVEVDGQKFGDMTNCIQCRRFKVNVGHALITIDATIECTVNVTRYDGHFECKPASLRTNKAQCDSQVLGDTPRLPMLQQERFMPHHRR